MPAFLPPLRTPNPALIKRLALLVAVGIAAFLLWTLSSLYEERKLMHQHRAERELQLISGLQAQAVAGWRAERLDDANALTDDSLFGLAVASGREISSPAQTDPAAQARPGLQGHAAFVRERLRILQERSRYTAVSFVDPEGTIVLGDRSGQSVPHAERQALVRALETAAPSVVEPRVDAFFAFPFFSLMAPIFDGTEFLGAVWLVADVRTSLFPLLSPWPTSSESAESVLVQAGKNGAVLLSPLRRHGSTGTSAFIPASDTKRPMVQAIAGVRGLFYARDDRGIPVMAVANAIADSPWYLVSKIDVQEAFGGAATRELLVLSLPVSAVLLIAGLLLGGWQWRARRRESVLKDKLAQNMQWLESAQKAALVGYYVYERIGGVFTLSPMASELFGLPAEEPVAREQWLAQVHPGDRAHVLASLDDALRGRKALRTQYRLIDGRAERWVDMWGQHDAPSENIHITGTVQDITERRLAEDKLNEYRAALETLVRQDPLTGVANRRALTEALAAELLRASRTRAPLSMLMIDVDHFKAFNDLYGHVAGDECLRKIAQTLAHSAARSSDLVARYGGEEFAVLLPGTGAQEAVAIAQKLRLAVRQLAIVHAASGVANVVTISVGIATRQAWSSMPDEESLRANAPNGAERDSQHLIHEADKALYAAKEGGRDTVVAWPETPATGLAPARSEVASPAP